LFAFSYMTSRWVFMILMILHVKYGIVFAIFTSGMRRTRSEEVSTLMQLFSYLIFSIFATFL
jgi:citrate lyase alpha subunit